MAPVGDNRCEVCSPADKYRFRSQTRTCNERIGALSTGTPERCRPATSASRVQWTTRTSRRGLPGRRRDLLPQRVRQNRHTRGPKEIILRAKPEQTPTLQCPCLFALQVPRPRQSQRGRGEHQTHSVLLKIQRRRCPSGRSPRCLDSGSRGPIRPRCRVVEGAVCAARKAACE